MLDRLLGRSKARCILPFEEARSRLDVQTQRDLEVAFGRAESGGKLKKGGFAKVEILRKYQVIEEQDNKVTVDCIFHSFDRGGKGYLSYEDFVIGFVIATRGTPTERLKMTVRLYDWEENGYISKSDFTKIYFMLAKEEGFLPQNDRSAKKKKGDEPPNPKQCLLEDVEKIFRSHRRKGETSYDKMYAFDVERFFTSDARGKSLKAFL